jgi:hypothetical protein
MKLEDSKRTTFDFQDQSFTVSDATPEVFDAFVMEFTEDVLNVDRTKWPIFLRWRWINQSLMEGVLLLRVLSDGSLRLDIPEEVSASPSEETGGGCEAKDISRGPA